MGVKKIITVYSSNETSFTSNGLGAIMPSLCDITQELNGMYELEIEHLLDAAGKWQLLIEGNIIKADGQLFRIYKKRKDITRIYINARHIFYDLLDNMIEDARPTDLNGAAALNWILTRTQYSHGFTSTSDILATSTAYYVRKNPVEAILGENGIVTRWNGELLRDNYTISLKGSLGLDRGVVISYGKNIVGIEEELDFDAVATRIMPLGYDALMLPEVYIDSALINNYPKPKIRIIEFPDIKIDEQNGIDEDTAIISLRAAASAYMTANSIDTPSVNYKVNFIELSNTEQYKSYAVLERVYLGDTVTIKHKILNFSLTAKCIKYKKDVLRNKYKEIELGNFKRNVGSSINKAIKEVSEVVEQNKSTLQIAIDNATELLNSSLGGYVVKRNGELLIMDTADPGTAQQVWKWNLAGLGYSGTGVNGPFDPAITMDGKINAKFINTETLAAAIIKTGMLASANNSSWINLDNGTFSLGGGRLALDNAGNFSINYTGTALQQALEGKANQAVINEMTQYLQWNATTGLTLSKLGSTFKIVIDNDSIDFKDGNSVIAWINGQKMFIKDLQATSSAIIGKHKIYSYSGGELTLIKYVGEGV